MGVSKKQALLILSVGLIPLFFLFLSTILTEYKGVLCITGLVISFVLWGACKLMSLYGYDLYIDPEKE